MTTPLEYLAASLETRAAQADWERSSFEWERTCRKPADYDSVSDYARAAFKVSSQIYDLVYPEKRETDAIA